MNNDTKAILISLCCLAFFSFFITGLIGSTYDYKRLLNCAENGTLSGPGEREKVAECESYPPAIIWIFNLFSAREIFLKQFLLFIFAFIAPLIFYKITKEPMATWFYFSASSYFFATITGSWLAQSLSLLLMFSMVFLNNRQRLIILGISIIIHSTSFYLTLLFFFLLLIEEGYFKKSFLVCSPFWGDTNGTILDTPIRTPITHSWNTITLNTLFSGAVKRTPLPFLYFAARGLWEERRIALLAMLVFFLATGVAYNERSLYFAALPMFCGLGFYYAKAGTKVKMFMVILSIAWFIFNYQQVFQNVQGCG